MSAEAGRDLLRPRPHLYAVIFGAWLAALAWFHPRLVTLLDAAHSPVAWGALLFFIVFTELAWLYGFYNIGVVIFAKIYHRQRQRERRPPPDVPDRPACPRRPLHHLQ